MKYSPHCQFQQYHIYINVLNMKKSEHIYIYYAYLYLSVSNSTEASKSDGGKWDSKFASISSTHTSGINVQYKE